MAWNTIQFKPDKVAGRDLWPYAPDETAWKFSARIGVRTSEATFPLIALSQVLMKSRLTTVISCTNLLQTLNRLRPAFMRLGHCF
jgi:hypothetical protein